MSITEKTGCNMRFLRVEVAEFIFATIMLSSMFVIAYRWNFLLGLLIGAFGLMFHELGHKVVGRWRCINDVHFIISPIGISLGYATSFLFGQALAAPGGVTVGENSSKLDRLWMGLAGPMSNVLVFVVFVSMHYIYPVTLNLVEFGLPMTDFPIWLAIAFVNLYLGFFNLLPIPMFDGSHIYRYNKWVWFITFTVVATMVALMWNPMTGTLVPLFQNTWGGLVGVTISGDIFKYMVPLFPGFMLMHGHQLSLSNLAVHSALDGEYEEL